ncbi:hypothetical protein MMPV_008269 [Pyropia vietnamensis]
MATPPAAFVHPAATVLRRALARAAAPTGPATSRRRRPPPPPPSHYRVSVSAAATLPGASSGASNDAATARVIAAKQAAVAAAARRSTATGPPLRYDPTALRAYWSGRTGELARRWTAFAGVATPWIGAVAAAAARGTLGDDAVLAGLTRSAATGMGTLGPTFVKLGQMLAVRPDVLPPACLAELSSLQDNVAPFSGDVARRTVCEELGIRSLNEVFTDWEEVPIAAASLAQVHRARLVGSGELVAVKVQRPSALETVSKDLYVLQRASGVFQAAVRRFTNQTTDYGALLDAWAGGFYNELDFLSEAAAQTRARQELVGRWGGGGWVWGVKLTDVSVARLRQLVPLGQTSFLSMLFDLPCGFHGDPHGGNLMAVDPERPPSGAPGARLVLLDWGLTLNLPEEVKASLLSSLVHAANGDWDGVMDDMVDLGILPASAEVDRTRIVGLLGRLLSPYIQGGGGLKGFLGEGGDVASAVRDPSMQALVRDLGAATVDIPFSLPPYVATLGRAMLLLEGVALRSDPNYKMVMASYPYVARRLVRTAGEGGAAGPRRGHAARRGAASAAAGGSGDPRLSPNLRTLLYADGRTLSIRRLVGLLLATEREGNLEAALSRADPVATDADTGELEGTAAAAAAPPGGAFVDLDSLPSGASGADVVRLLLRYAPANRASATSRTTTPRWRRPRPGVAAVSTAAASGALPSPPGGAAPLSGMALLADLLLEELIVVADAGGRALALVAPPAVRAALPSPPMALRLALPSLLPRSPVAVLAPPLTPAEADRLAAAAAVAAELDPAAAAAGRADAERLPGGGLSPSADASAAGDVAAAADAAALVGVARGLTNVPGVREGEGGVHPVVRRLVGELAGVGGGRLQGLLVRGGGRGGRPVTGNGAWWE